MWLRHACSLRDFSSMFACSDVRAVSSGVCCPNTFKSGHQPRWNTCCWGETKRTNPKCISDMLNIISSPESVHCLATGEKFKANCSNLYRDNKSKLGWGQCNALHCKMTKCSRGWYHAPYMFVSGILFEALSALHLIVSLCETVRMEWYHCIKCRV